MLVVESLSYNCQQKNYQKKIIIEQTKAVFSVAKVTLWLSESTHLTTANTVILISAVNHFELLTGMFPWHESARCLV